MIKSIYFQVFFSKYRWYRKLIGGKWKLEWCELTHSYAWSPAGDSYFNEIFDYKNRIYIREENYENPSKNVK